jgi:hypothetical protein
MFALDLSLHWRERFRPPVLPMRGDAEREQILKVDIAIFHNG